MKGKRGCRFGCFHIELIKDAEGKQKTICKKGWPRVQKACFSRLQYETEDLARQEEFKNENPHVFQAQRDHPFEGMSNPVAQVVMRCNVDVKYIGRAFAEEDLNKFCDGSMSSDVDESHTDGVHAQGHLRPVVPQPVAGSSQPELSERDLSDMDAAQQDTGGTASQDSGCKRKKTTVVHEKGHLRPVVPQPVAGSSQPELSERDLCDMDVGQQDTGGTASQDSGFKRKKTTVLSQSVPESKRMQTMKMALERVLIDMSRDMQDVGFYTGEYAAKKNEISRSMLPELYAGRICVVTFLFCFVIVIGVVVVAILVAVVVVGVVVVVVLLVVVGVVVVAVPFNLPVVVVVVVVLVVVADDLLPLLLLLVLLLLLLVLLPSSSFSGCLLCCCC